MYIFYPLCMMKLILRAGWECKYCWPVALHHLIGSTSINSSIGCACQVNCIFKNFLIMDDPVHFPVESCHKTIQGCMHKRDHFSHFIFVWVLSDLLFCLYHAQHFIIIFIPFHSWLCVINTVLLQQPMEYIFNAICFPSPIINSFS